MLDIKSSYEFNDLNYKMHSKIVRDRVFLDLKRVVTNNIKIDFFGVYMCVHDWNTNIESNYDI